jgi:hypothetical protein
VKREAAKRATSDGTGTAEDAEDAEDSAIEKKVLGSQRPQRARR